jgi:hypothetical protein
LILATQGDVRNTMTMVNIHDVISSQAEAGKPQLAGPDILSMHAGGGRRVDESFPESAKP